MKNEKIEEEGKGTCNRKAKVEKSCRNLLKKVAGQFCQVTSFAFNQIDVRK